MRELLDHIANPIFAVLSLAILGGMFIFICYWVFFRTSKTKMKEHAQIPLEDKPVHPRKEGDQEDE